MESLAWFFSEGPILMCNSSGTLLEVENCNISGVFQEDENCSAALKRNEDPRIDVLRHYAYGVALPTICCLGILGNVLNLIVLTRRNMKGTAYIYMRGYSTASLFAIIFAIPFGLRVLVHQESGRWTNVMQAFYHAHLELFLGNACLGVGVMMLLALTVERYVSVCHPGHVRPSMGPPRWTVSIITLLTFVIYIPTAFSSELRRCLLNGGTYIYYKRSNIYLKNSTFFAAYKIILEIIYKVIPTVLLAGLNMKIMIVYRKSCDKRRRMTLYRSSSSDVEDHRKFAEERRLMLLLGSTSILFLVCVSPMVFLNLTLSEQNLNRFSYQIFRAVANLLEVINYSITFYIYCLFSEDFRNTLLKTLQWPWKEEQKMSPGTITAMEKKLLSSKPSPPPTTTTTNTVTRSTTTACIPVPSSGTAQRFWRGLTSCTASNGGSKGIAERASV